MERLATFSRGGERKWSVRTTHEPPRQALIFAHRSYLLYTQKTTPVWVWSFSLLYFLFQIIKCGRREKLS